MTASQDGARPRTATIAAVVITKDEEKNIADCLESLRWADELIVVDAENHPCRYPADIIARHHPEATRGFVSAAMHKRGVVGWVEAEGMIHTGDAIIVWIPPQRIYSHA